MRGIFERNLGEESEEESGRGIWERKLGEDSGKGTWGERNLGKGSGGGI